MHEFEELETWVLTALGPLISEGLKTLELYTGQADAKGIEDLAKITARFPCVYVLATGLTLNDKNKYDEETIGAMLVVGDRNLRKADSAKLGDSQSMGVYALLERTEALLHREKVYSAGILKLERVAPLFLSPKKGVCFYAAYYKLNTIKS
jgi:phage gp37-like protein